MAWGDFTNPEAWKQAMAGLLRRGGEVGEYVATAPEKASQAILDAGQRQQALMNEAFDPTGKTLIRNPQAANQAAMNLFEGPLSFAPAGITAWHGSPHTFDKFDMSKVGTGEGAQAYGHGMYFAESPEVAKTYRKSEVTPASLNANSGKSFNSIQDFFDSVAEKPGNLYKVDIPDEHIPTMMDWDKPLGQQSTFVKKAINNLKKQVTPEMKMELGDDLNLLFGKDITPSQFLNTWEIIHPTGGTGIGEKLLNEQGVKGIRYLDQASRGAKTGTSNFVVFDPTDVKILERNNQPLTRKEILEEGFSKAENPLVDIFHGTDPKSAKAIEKSGFDVTKSADGTIWFTSNPNIGEVAATGKGGIVKRKLDQSKMKLGGWEEADKYSTNELIQKGYDGLMLKDSDGITYQIFNPEKLLK